MLRQKVNDNFNSSISHGVKLIKKSKLPSQYPSIFSFHLNPPPNRVLFLEEGIGYRVCFFFFFKRDRMYFMVGYFTTSGNAVSAWNIISFAERFTSSAVNFF